MTETAVAKEERIQHVQIAIWLGSRQRVEIQADSRVTFDEEKHDADFVRTGSANAINPGDIVEVVTDVLSKLRDAFGKTDTIDLCVDGQRIVACVAPKSAKAADAAGPGAG